MKKILFVDMDGVLVDFCSGIEALSPELRSEYHTRYDECPNIFSLMRPMKGAVDAFNYLSVHFDTYILSTAPWDNPTAWHDKLLWVKKYLGDSAYKRLIFSHHKNLCHGDFLIDDRMANGADKFTGEHIHFGEGNFTDWFRIVSYLINKLEGTQEENDQKALEQQYVQDSLDYEEPWKLWEVRYPSGVWYGCDGFRPFVGIGDFAYRRKKTLPMNRLPKKRVTENHK